MIIFLIDDNPVERVRQLGDLIGPLPHPEPVQISSTDEFEDAIQKVPPSLVITSLDLQWSDGEKVLERVKDLYPHCPVCVVAQKQGEATVVDLLNVLPGDVGRDAPRTRPRIRVSIPLASVLIKRACRNEAIAV